MPAPANVDELLDLIQKSGVVENDKLRNYIQKLKEAGSLPTDPSKLASTLVRDAILTYFQAEHLLQGKYKRFTIGKYKVLERLGAGGMAQVFLCEHKLMRRRVAIKVLPTAKVDDPSSLDRFRREARAIAAVDHPNIVRAYDIDQDENLHFLVMEYVDGTNLQDLIKKFGPLDVLRACHYIYGATVGLQHAHEKGLVHRDIKPGNILLDRSGVIKLLDMGLARFFHDDDDALTKKYDENVLGTADYLAPEQAIDSHSVDIRADIYSLGATFYYLLTASALFPEGSVAQKLIWHQNKQPRPIRSLRSDVPPEIAAIVERMMAKEPAQRYQTPAEVLVALAPWVTTPIPPPPDREMPQVSPAAGGVPRGPVSVTNSSPLGYAKNPGLHAADSPTLVASAPATPTQSIPTVPSSSANPFELSTPLLNASSSDISSIVWESLDSETKIVGQADTDRSVRKPESASRIHKQSASKPGSRLPLLFVAFGVLLLVGAAAGIYFSLFRKPAGPAPAVVPATHTITVSSGGGENTVTTLRAALSQAHAGDTIVIAEPKLIESTLRINKENHKDLTIESGLPNGKMPVIEFQAPKDTKNINAGAMLSVDPGVEGFHLKNIEFDGKNAIATGIQINGTALGTTIENVTIQSVKTGLMLQNAAGDANRPIVLEKLRTLSIGIPPTPASAPESGTAILLKDANVDIRWVKIRNCRFEGPCKDGIHIEGGGGTAEVEITGNRFYKITNALAFSRPAEKKTIQARIARNTVFESKRGIAFDFLPPPPNQPAPAMGKFDLIIQHNYFANTVDIGKYEGDQRPDGAIKSENNAFDSSGGGNIDIQKTDLPNPKLASTNPGDDDSRFLRFQGGPPPLPNGVRVGTP